MAADRLIHSARAADTPAAQRSSRPAMRGGGRALCGASLWLAGVTVLCIGCWSCGAWPLAALCWPWIAWQQHACLVRLHEAAHGVLGSTRRANELLGIVVGTLSLTPLSVYRDVHARHHAHLGRELDPEFWPYNLPQASRARRVAYAWAELLLGVIVTPLLYSLRTARAWPQHRPNTRRRLLLEWATLLAFWSTALLLVDRTACWTPFAVGVLAPAWLTGTAQTLRKFVEHLGLAGDSMLTSTRTIVYRGRLGRWLSRRQLHVEHHGTHHRWPRIPSAELPRATARARARGEAMCCHASHLDALCEMLPHLVDPRVGPQWSDIAAAPDAAGAGSQPVDPIAALVHRYPGAAALRPPRVRPRRPS